MFFRLNRLVIKNLGSFGNKEFEFDFNVSGINVVSAKNGSGKSMLLLDSIAYVLFGKPYRDIKLKSLLNRFNKSGLEVSLEFSIDDISNYKIKRGMKPDILEITKNDSDMELLSSKKLIQDDIDKIIGIDYETFKNVIALATSYNQPYLKLSAAKKRELVEDMFKMDIFSKMLVNAKNDETELKTENKILIERNKGVEKLVESKKSNFETITELSQSTRNNKDAKILNLEISIEGSKKAIENLKIQRDQLLAKCKDFDFDLIRSKIEDLCEIQSNIKSEISVEKFKYKDLISKKEFYENNETCPSCKTILDAEHISKHISEFNLSIEESTEKLLELANTKTKTENNLKKLEDLRDTILDNLTDVKSVDRNIEISEKLIVVHQNEIKSIKNEESIIDDSKVASAKKELMLAKVEEQKIKGGLDKLTYDQEVIKLVKSLLSDTGIKTFLLSKIVPIFNKKINYYINRFDLPIVVEFDHHFQETIKDFYNNEIEYGSFSEGEKKRIDLSILLSFIETMKVINNWNCNILIFDEMLDQGVDDDSLSAIIKSINDISKEDPELCVYLISHRNPEGINYSRKIILSKVDNFTEVEYEEGQKLEFQYI